MEGMRPTKRELQGAFTSLGVSNVSFGLAPDARAVLNSVFLHHCVEAGLDMAIVNPAHVQPSADPPGEDRAAAEYLLYTRRPDPLQRSIEHFDATGGARWEGKTEKEDPPAGMS